MITVDRRPIRIVRLFLGQEPDVCRNHFGLRREWWERGGEWLLTELDRVAAMGYRRVMIYCPGGRLWLGGRTFDVYPQAAAWVLPPRLVGELRTVSEAWRAQWGGQVYLYLGHRIQSPYSRAMAASHPPDVESGTDMEILSANLDPWLPSVDGFGFDNMSANEIPGAALLGWLEWRGLWCAGEAVPRDAAGRPARLENRWFARGRFYRAQDPGDTWTVDPSVHEVIAAMHRDDIGRAASFAARGFTLASYHDDLDAEVLSS